MRFDVERMKDAVALLKQWLLEARRLAVLGAGSVLKADDGAGVLLVERLLEDFQSGPRLLLCPGETAPENFSGKIKAFGPTHLLVVDAADLKEAPGTIMEINPRDVGGPTFCSHMLPLRVMIDYLAAETGAEVLLLGIQPESIEFDAPMTPAVKAAVEGLCGVLGEAIGILLGVSPPNP